MLNEILKVNDIDEAVREFGLSNFTDRLVQDRRGYYFYIEGREIEMGEPIPLGFSLFQKKIWSLEGDCPVEQYEREAYFIYKSTMLPKDIAFFIIDAMRLKSDIIGIGSGSYEGLHGGRLMFVAKEAGEGEMAQINPANVRIVQIEQI